MTWVAIDDQLWADPRYIALSGDAAKLYAAAFAWCGAHLTDGLVTDATVATLARMYRLKNPEALAAELLASGLWTAAPEGHAVAGFLDHNRPASYRETARRETRERVKNWRERHRSNSVTPGAARVQKSPGNAVTGEAVTEPQHSTAQTQDVLYEEGEEGLDTDLVDQLLAPRGRRNGYATEDEVRDLEAAALAEELAE